MNECNGKRECLARKKKEMGPNKNRNDDKKVDTHERRVD